MEILSQPSLPATIVTGFAMNNKAYGINRLRALLAEHSRRAFSLGLVWGTSGNMSIRADKKSFLISATGKSLGDITVRDIVRCGTEKAHVSRNASMEWMLHSRIYQSRKDANAVLHSQPPYSTLIACARDRKIRTALIPETVAYLQHTGVVPYRHAGSPELAEKCAEAARKADVLILENHGVVALGASIDEAVNRALTLEFLCRLTVLSRSSGIELKEISPRQAKEFLKRLRGKKGV